MATKTMSLKTTKAILIDQSAFLASVNELRKSRGTTKKLQAPATIEKILTNTKVLSASTEDFGNIYFSIHYEDKEGNGCIRDFPNFGLNVVSKSTLVGSDGQVTIDINLTLTSGKKKWQLDEVEECVEIFSGGKYQISLKYSCDTTSEPAGYSVGVQVLNGIAEKSGNTKLPNSMFECTWK